MHLLALRTSLYLCVSELELKDTGRKEKSKLILNENRFPTNILTVRKLMLSGKLLLLLINYCIILLQYKRNEKTKVH